MTMLARLRRMAATHLSKIVARATNRAAAFEYTRGEKCAAHANLFPAAVTERDKSHAGAAAMDSTRRKGIDALNGGIRSGHGSNAVLR